MVEEETIFKTCRRHAYRSRCFPLSLESADRSVPLNVQTRYRSYFHKYLSLAEPGDRYIADMTADTVNTAYLKNVTYSCLRDNFNRDDEASLNGNNASGGGGKTQSVKFR